jgi:class 3 adenylate cyclase
LPARNLVYACETPCWLELRVGIHTRESELHEGKVAGVALAVGARVCAEAAAGEVLGSRTVKDLVAGSGLSFRDECGRELRGVGEWELHAVA